MLSFINGNKFSQEILAIKLKLQAIEGLTKESVKERCPVILLKLKQLYFPDENSSQMLLNQVADKNLKTIVNMVY